MPIPIGRLSSRATSSDPAELLHECHDRIRQHMRGASALAGAAADDPAIAPTAQAVHRYFRIALPLHAQDEDVSVGPRLADTGLPDSYHQAVADMTAQHADIDAVLDRLLPAWRRLVEEPSALDSIRETLTADTAALEALWRIHLEMEEQIVFPLIAQRLDESTRATIVSEMRDRRRS